MMDMLAVRLLALHDRCKTKGDHRGAEIAAAAIAKIAELSAEIDMLEVHMLAASRYQPMYNGRPSCPFCGNFNDAEETHSKSCVIINLKRFRR